MIWNERVDTLMTRSVGIICSPLVLIIIPARFSPSKVFMYVRTPLPLFLAFSDTDCFLSFSCVRCPQASKVLASGPLDPPSRTNASKSKCTPHVDNTPLRKAWGTLIDEWKTGKADNADRVTHCSSHSRFSVNCDN